MDARVQRGLLFERDLRPLPHEKLRDLFELAADAFGLVLAHERDVSKAAGHARDYTTATPCGAP